MKKKMVSFCITTFGIGLAAPAAFGQQPYAAPGPMDNRPQSVILVRSADGREMTQAMPQVVSTPLVPATAYYPSPNKQMVMGNGQVIKAAAPAPMTPVVPMQPEPGRIGYPSYGTECACEDNCFPACTSECHRDFRLSTFGEFLYLSVRGADVVYAQQEDVLGGPNGPLGIVSSNYDPGFRVGATWAMNSCAGLEAVYSHFESHARDTIVAGEDSFLRALVRGPNSPTISPTSLAAAARYDIDFDMVDLDYKQVLCGDCDYLVNCVAGVRLGHMDQDFAALFEINGSDRVTSSIRHQGIGPCIGLEGEYLVGHGFMVFGRGLASFLVTNVDAHYLDTNIFAGSLTEVNYQDDRIVPSLELEMGVGWTNCRGNIRLKAGYYAAAWFNTVTTPGFIEAVQSTNFSSSSRDLSDTITFDGLTARFEYRW